MTRVVTVGKGCTINPLKVSAPLGAALAYMGVDGAMPLFHGAQGCTAFAVVMLVRHFREAAPFQTTALDELTTILGGSDNLEEALQTLHGRAAPQLIGICTTALTETRGEDMVGDLRGILGRHPEWGGMAVVLANTPDYLGGLEQGWAAATAALVEALAVPVAGPRNPHRLNILAGSHLTPADGEALHDLVAAFGASAVILPDLSRSLDGHLPDRYTPTSLGGTPVAAIRSMGDAVATLALGEHMRPAAERLERKTGVPTRVIDRLMGLEGSDRLVAAIAEATGLPVPERVRRSRSRLVDTMLDAHFWFGGKRAAVAAEPDLLLSLSALLCELGCRIAPAVTTVNSRALDGVTAETVVIGDLDDFERLAPGADVLITHSHGRQAAARLNLPLLRIGFPIFDRLGATQRRTIGYRGSQALIFELANLWLAAADHTAADDAADAPAADAPRADVRESDHVPVPVHVQRRDGVRDRAVATAAAVD